MTEKITQFYVTFRFTASIINNVACFRSSEWSYVSFLYQNKKNMLCRKYCFMNTRCPRLNSYQKSRVLNKLRGA